MPSRFTSEHRVAMLTVEVNLLDIGWWEVVIPDGDDGEYVRTYSAAGASDALGQAGQYVESVIHEMQNPSPLAELVGRSKSYPGNLDTQTEDTEF